MMYLTRSFHGKDSQGAPSIAQNFRDSYDFKMELKL